MVKKNQQLTVYVSAQGNKGEGIAYVENLPIHIDNTLPQDEVTIKILKVTKLRAFAKLLLVITPSPTRVVPLCLVATSCGGCQLQHQLYQSQLNFKQFQLKQVLDTHVTNLGNIYKPIVALSEPWRFRYKMQFALAIDTQTQQLKVGLYASRTHRVVDSHDCKIATSQINQVVDHVKRWYDKVDVTVFNEQTGQGSLRFLTVRQVRLNEKVMVILTVAQQTDCLTSFVNDIKRIACVCSIYVCYQADKTIDNILSDELILLWGDKQLEEELLSIRCYVSAQSFMQGNALLVERLYQQVIDCCSAAKNTRVLDIYCGVGILSLALAKQGFDVIGIDLNQQAILDAQRNNQLNGLDVKFVCQAAEQFLTTFDCTEYTVVLDPPRQGCHVEVLQALCHAQPAVICYVSCNPVTLGQDLKELVAAGYIIDAITPVDMFSQSIHLEAVVILKSGLNFF